jgi:hypothetical protein
MADAKTPVNVSGTEIELVAASPSFKALSILGHLINNARTQTKRAKHGINIKFRSVPVDQLLPFLIIMHDVEVPLLVVSSSFLSFGQDPFHLS